MAAREIMAVEVAPGASNIANIANVYECYLTYSRKRMSALWNKASKLLDKTQRKYLKDIYDAKKGKYSTQEMMATPIIYRINTTTEMGRLGYGRYYSSPAGAECLESTIRGTLLCQTHTDVDIKNCHPTLIYQYAKTLGLEMPFLEYYARNTDRVRSQLMADTGLTKKQVKDLFIITLYNGIPDNIKHSAIETNGMVSHKLLEDIGREMKAFTTVVKASGLHNELWEALGRLKKKNRDGSFISYIIQREERRVVEVMMAFSSQKNLNVDAIAYDGFAFRGSIDDSFLRDAEHHVLSSLQYRIELEKKPWDSIPDEQLFAEGDTAQYQTMRTEFEKNHAYYRVNNTIVEMDGERLLTFSLEHARVAFNTLRLDDEKEPLFIKKWIDDPHRRIVNKLVLKRDEDVGDGEFNLFTGLAYKKLSEEILQEDRDQYVSVFNDLLRSVCGDDEPTFQYVLRYFAHLLTDMSDEPIGVAIFFISYQQGTGKDTLMKIIRHLVGETHTAHHNGDTFWDKHNTASSMAFLEYVEDAPRDFITKANLGLFKNKITSDVRSYNPKNKDAYSVQNRCHSVVTTNETSLLNLEDSDRRIYPIVCSTRLMKTDWARIYRLIKTPAFLQAVGEYLESISYKDWDLHKIPETDFRAEVKGLSKTSEARFLESFAVNGLDKTEMKDLYPLYQKFCVEQSIPSCLNAISLGRKLLPYVGTLIKRETDSRKITWYWIDKVSP